MPAQQCNNGKWKWGANGACIFDTRKEAEIAGIAIIIKKLKEGKSGYGRSLKK
jgi:hypothetical protein